MDNAEAMEREAQYATLVEGEIIFYRGSSASIGILTFEVKCATITEYSLRSFTDYGGVVI